ncbi:hypothetical protein [Chlorogloea sp. CCALA 695]|nr:hypothetical protein [Chlorogloea sp. CCALA 695]
MTKERFQREGLELVEVPTKFVNHWQDEAMRLRDLAVATHNTKRFRPQ